MSSKKIYEKPTTTKLLDRMKMNDALAWLSDMVRILKHDEIIVPTNYRDKVLVTKSVLSNDVSGLVNSLLDFAIEASLVDYTIKTPNENLTKKLNKWLNNINSDLRGKIPVGLKALAKEYFRERWKGSSFLLLRTFWSKEDGLSLPTTAYFVDGEDIKVLESKDNISLDGKTYYLRINEKKEDDKKLPNKRTEDIFIQKPYTSWGITYPTPFLIQRGIYKNLKFLELLEKKGEFVVGKALEYLGLLKKGTEGMAMSSDPQLRYSEKDLQLVKEKFANMVSARKVGKGVTTHVANFDTTFEHLIPEYIKALDQKLYTPIERRILAGLGLVDIVQGIASTRRESILNPKPYFAEITSAIQDFKVLLDDIMAIVIERNKVDHRKYFGEEVKVLSTPVKQSLTDDLLVQFRSAYDRGVLSKQTYDEVLGIDLEVEIERRKKEKKHKEILYPPVIQNLEQLGEDEDVNENIDNEDIPDDKKGPEKKNYNKSDIEKGKIVKRKDGYYVLSEKNKNLGGPYKTRKEAEKRLHQVEYFKNKK